MNFFVETLKVLGLSVVYYLEAFLRVFVPPRRKSVEGELVLLTGAAAGLGRIMALEFARLGARLVLWDIDQEGNLETARLVREAHGARAHTYTCDCSSREEVYKVADRVGTHPLCSVLYTCHCSLDSKSNLNLFCLFFM